MCHQGLITGGFATLSYYYLPLRWYLRQAGFEADFIHPGPLALNIWPLETYLRNAVDALSAIDGDCFLVGHSLGGIQSVLLADLFPEKVKKVFTVGSPVHGCPVKLYESAILTLINVSQAEFEMFQQEVIPRVANRIVTISCENDTLAPSEVCAIEGAANYKVEADDAGISASHLLIPYLPATVQIISEETRAIPSHLPSLGVPA